MFSPPQLYYAELPANRPQFIVALAGDVTIEPCETVDYLSWRILVMGPTGSGKSSFIESLAGPGQSLGISKDQLAGFTQDINAYKLNNSQYLWDDGERWPVYIVDSPGFSDGKLSGMEIVNRTKEWMSEKGFKYISLILYLCPITDTRMTRTRLRVINMLQALLEKRSAGRVIIVTTMWDRITNARAMEQAEAHYEQLKNDVFKDLLQDRAQITKFHNTQKSALSILKVDLSIGEYAPLTGSPLEATHPAAGLLYQELLDCISNAQREKHSLRQDQIRLIVTPDPLLESVILPRIEDAHRKIERFRAQLEVLGTPPPGFELVHEQLSYQDLIDQFHDAQQVQQAIRDALIQLRSQPTFELGSGSTLQGQLMEAKKRVEVCAAKLVEFGIPPKGMDHLVIPYRILAPKDCIKQAAHRGRQFLNKFKKG
ncbi:P-loop containing nucleoside triphosphate hydrolase protein [Panaeolus papilionaceus]|nr:P-loop containing nucleoside triphosphate hydrolase protein [Panaeolus papilionaceus]